MEGYANDIEIRFAQNLIERYSGDEWKDLISFKEEMYNRIKLFRNDQIEILLLCWEKNQGSPIHNHPQHGMVMKVLEGELFENRYKSLEDIEKPIQ